MHVSSLMAVLFEDFMQARHALVVMLFLLLVRAPADAAKKVNPEKTPVPRWLWAGQAKDNQSVFFRFTFETPAYNGIKNAQLWTTCDNEVTAYINGKKVAANSNWQVPVTEEVGAALRPGKNTLAFLGRNENSTAGFIAKLHIQFNDGNALDVVSNDKWRISEEMAKGWEAKDFNDAGWAAPRVIGDYGIGPWSKLPHAGKAGAFTQATPASEITAPEGFKVELLYSVPKEKEDSWVSMTTDPRGRLIVSGQDGPMFRVTVGAKPQDTRVEKIDVPLGHAQGLLWAYDSLYVTVNGGGIAGHSNGLYRVTDTNNDDKLDKVETLFKLNGGTGEHGPHATRLGPDGKIYLVAGNFTGPPEDLIESPHRNWAEDQLLPRNPDGGGHDPHIMAPGGWIVRMDKDGKNRQLFCAGLRNTYDFDFNPDGELFTFDSDMEWDTGTPWYRPIRVNLAVSGGEYGWRNGTGKWPEFYPDSLGAVVNMSLGSPTGVTFATKAKFPAKYQRAFFVSDWSYGNVYAVYMTPEGAGYRGTFERFIFGKPFGVTDCIINPTDGNMYITIGGRGSQSGLYRVSYVGNESTSPVPWPADPKAAEARKLRHKLEEFQVKEDSAAVDFLWPYLDSSDRYLRYAARVALERQNINQWKQKALDEKSPTAAINALIALIRAGSISDGQRPDKTMAFKPNLPLQKQILEALDRLPTSGLSEEQTLEGLRALGLCFIRLGEPDAQSAAEIATKLDPMYPSQSQMVNRELGRMLAYLQSPTVVEKSMKLLTSADTQEDQLHYVLILRGVKTGWTPELRKAYFTKINTAQNKYAGGHSFKNFMIRIREDAIKMLSPEEKTALGPVLENKQTVATTENEAAPRQFVRNWQMSDILPVIAEAQAGRSFEKGRIAYGAAQCAKCHRFGNEGGSTGPDLTGAGNRFAPADVLESILQPSKVISDQYRPNEFITRKHTIVSGQVEAEDEQSLTIRANPLSTETVKLKKSDIATSRPAKLSLMPEGLLDTLNEQEILDLIAYVRSGGNMNDKAFAKKS